MTLAPCSCGDEPHCADTGHGYVVRCDCGAEGPPAPSKKLAAVRWNRARGLKGLDVIKGNLGVQ